MTREEKIELVQPILDTFVNDDIKEFAIELLDDLPEYIWSVGASSTGKYHPAYSLGEGGLMRHQMAVVRFLNFFFELEQYNSKLTTREMDLMRLAGLVHDGRKSGSQEDYQKSKYTKFDHPLLVGEFIKENKANLNFTDDEIQFLSDAIASHMGPWTKDYDGNEVLPYPKTKYQNFVHMCDYLASKKFLNVDFDENNNIVEE